MLWLYYKSRPYRVRFHMIIDCDGTQGVRACPGTFHGSFSSHVVQSTAFRCVSNLIMEWIPSHRFHTVHARPERLTRLRECTTAWCWRRVDHLSCTRYLFFSCIIPMYWYGYLYDTCMVLAVPNYSFDRPMENIRDAKVACVKHILVVVATSHYSDPYANLPVCSSLFPHSP